MDAVSQMPVVLLPIHFDRFVLSFEICIVEIVEIVEIVDILFFAINLFSSQLERVPSCCRSVVIRPFRLKEDQSNFLELFLCQFLQCLTCDVDSQDPRFYDGSPCNPWQASLH